ncbi:MAG: SAM-dependent methyltransferase [Candidatus Omnitrophica bacterium]|nr:SAM-dependent methyltransferase [Candidatus Omnitrophota bacterium]
MIITKNEWDQIKKQKPGDAFSLDIDFGIHKINVKRTKTSVIFADRFEVDIEYKVKDNFCYLVDKEGLTKVAFFSNQTKKLYKLVPTRDWPTISISSVPMHQLKSPKKDTEAKIKLIRPFGHVLDTCMGLGYTAILAKYYSQRVETFEKDKNVYKIAKINPLSKSLFNDHKIIIHQQDISKQIGKFNNYFDCIIHDPPTFKLAPVLFSESFYFKLKSALKRGGKLFNYTPLYKIKSGYNFPAKIKGKLKKTGFRGIKFDQKALGIICQK